MNKHNLKIPTATDAPITELPASELAAVIGAGLYNTPAFGGDELLVVKTDFAAGFEMGSSMN